MKFSIRDLIFVTIIVALSTGWWLDASKTRALTVENQRLRNNNKMLAESVKEWFEEVSNKKLIKPPENVP